MLVRGRPANEVPRPYAVNAGRCCRLKQGAVCDGSVPRLASVGDASTSTSTGTSAHPAHGGRIPAEPRAAGLVRPCSIMRALSRLGGTAGA